MGFFTFLGRVLFASLFILSAWQMYNEFDANDGTIANELISKLIIVKQTVSSEFGVRLPDIDARRLVATIIFLKGVGGIQFVFGSTLGSFLLLLNQAITTPLLYDFYNYESSRPKYKLLLNDFMLNVALFGALLFFLGMKNSFPRRHQKQR